MFDGQIWFSKHMLLQLPRVFPSDKHSELCELELDWLIPLCESLSPSSLFWAAAWFPPVAKVKEVDDETVKLKTSKDASIAIDKIFLVCIAIYNMYILKKYIDFQ